MDVIEQLAKRVEDTAIARRELQRKIMVSVNNGDYRVKMTAELEEQRAYERGLRDALAIMRGEQHGTYHGSAGEADRNACR